MAALGTHLFLTESLEAPDATMTRMGGGMKDDILRKIKSWDSDGPGDPPHRPHNTVCSVVPFLLP